MMTSFTSIIARLQKDPLGILHLGEDGVLRSLSSTCTVIDAVGLTPSQIKEGLERMPEWSQEIEDKFCGVDGSQIIDKKALFEPPEGVSLPKPDPERAEAARRYNKDEQVRLEQEARQQTCVENNECCGKKRTTYNLDPK